MLTEQIDYTCYCCGWNKLDFKPYERYPYSIPSDIAKLPPPYYNHWGKPSYGVCDCCGFEFGQDDDPGTATPVTFAEYRKEWISQENATWFSPEKKPANWSLEEQLKQIDAL